MISYLWAIVSTVTEPTPPPGLIERFFKTVIGFIFPVWDGLAGVLMAALLAIPMWGVRLIVLGLLAGLAVWGMTLPRDYAFKGSPEVVWYRDVRIMAVIVIALEMIPYIVF